MNNLKPFLSSLQRSKCSIYQSWRFNMTHLFFRNNKILAILLVSALLVTGVVTVPTYNAKAALCSYYYMVQPGDNLYQIASKFGVNWQDLASVNGIANPHSLQAGKTLCITNSHGPFAAKYYPKPNPPIKPNPYVQCSPYSPYPCNPYVQCSPYSPYPCNPKPPIFYNPKHNHH